MQVNYTPDAFTSLLGLVNFIEKNNTKIARYAGWIDLKVFCRQG